MDNKTKIFIAFPFVFIIILLVAANYIPLASEPSETEGQILAFIPAGLSIKDSPMVSVSGEIKSPIEFLAAPAELDQGKKDDIVAEISYNDSDLSLIVVSGARKMAIIKGLLVREGDSIDSLKIAAIEPDRVLIKNKTEKWLHLEKVK